MSRVDFSAITVIVTGAKINLGPASSSVTIPVMADGTRARFVILSTTTSAHVRIGTGAQTAVDTDMLVVSDAPLIVKVMGSDTIAAIEGQTAGKLVITPLEA
jgi:hypothetical protein